MCSEAKFDREALAELWQHLLNGLAESETTVNVSTLQTWLKVGSLRSLDDRYDLETTLVFDFHLQKQKAYMLELARSEPGTLDTYIGIQRANYCIVANKLLKAYNGGHELLNNKNSTLDLSIKQKHLFEMPWLDLYNELESSLVTSSMTETIEWSLIAIKLRRRQLHDESTASPYWKRRCPYQTNFLAAYRKYPLIEVKQKLNQAF